MSSLFPAPGRPWIIWRIGSSSVLLIILLRISRASCQQRLRIILNIWSCWPPIRFFSRCNSCCKAVTQFSVSIRVAMPTVTEVLPFWAQMNFYFFKSLIFSDFPPFHVLLASLYFLYNQVLLKKFIVFFNIFVLSSKLIIFVKQYVFIKQFYHFWK